MIQCTKKIYYVRQRFLACKGTCFQFHLIRNRTMLSIFTRNGNSIDIIQNTLIDALQSLTEFSCKDKPFPKIIISIVCVDMRETP